MLQKIKILSFEELSQLEEGLDVLALQIENGTFAC